ncbi:MAG: signal peptide peptidase SppA [Verrucomicrobiales bacterium]|nr:signal peptide peptidase SppA [Verrucomicrobiales bacterium]
MEQSTDQPHGAGSDAPPPPPPPVQPPPVLYAQPTIIRKGRGWKYFALILLVLLVLSSLSSLEDFFGETLGVTTGIQGPARSLQEVLVESAGVTDKIAILDVRGVIYGGYVGGGDLGPVDVLRLALERAGKDAAVRAVILRIDSPGGEVLAADDIARAIADFQQEQNKPVIATMEGLAASGGYYVAAPCRWIVANPLTLTGSIGVIMSGYNYRGLMDKAGVRPVVFKSGRMKNMLSGSRAEDEIPPEEAELLNALIRETFDRFKQVIAEGRGTRLQENWQNFADGRIFLGTEALELGFIDQLGDFDDAVSKAKALVGISEASLIRYDAPRRLGGLLRLLGEAGDAKVHVDLGVNLPKMEIGRPYFLYAPGL